MTTPLDRRNPAETAVVAPSRRTALNLSLASLGAALLAASAARRALAQTAVVVDVQEVARGFRFSELRGRPVVNTAGQNIGTLDDIIIDQNKVLYAILQVGGFLGLGGYLVAVPFDSLTISPDGKTITVAEASKSQLQKMPQFNYSQPAGGNKPANTQGSTSGSTQGNAPGNAPANKGASK